MQQEAEALYDQAMERAGLAENNTGQTLAEGFALKAAFAAVRAAVVLLDENLGIEEKLLDGESSLVTATAALSTARAIVVEGIPTEEPEENPVPSEPEPQEITQPGPEEPPSGPSKTDENP